MAVIIVFLVLVTFCYQKWFVIAGRSLSPCYVCFDCLQSSITGRVQIRRGITSQQSRAASSFHVRAGGGLYDHHEIAHFLSLASWCSRAFVAEDSGRCPSMVRASSRNSDTTCQLYFAEHSTQPHLQCFFTRPATSRCSRTSPAVTYAKRCEQIATERKVAALSCR